MPRTVRHPHAFPNLSKRQNDAMLPHKTYMQLAFLELERARHEKERELVHNRLKAIQARIRQIESQKAELLASVSAQEGKREPCTSNVGNQEASPNSSNAGLEFRY